MQPRYRRILLKLSGEALQGAQGGPHRIDGAMMTYLVAQLQELCDLGVQCAIVVGGGNFFRGLEAHNIAPTTADYMGMLATCMNGLALRDSLNQAGVPCLLQSALPITSVVGPYQREEAIDALSRGLVVIFVGGTGHPYFTTDTAAALRAVEINADALLKATKVDGVYSADPMKNSSATRFDHITYDMVLQQKLHVMDSTAFTLCRDHNLSLIVFQIFKAGALKKVVTGVQEGTLCTVAV